jgi:hypothetical protein
VLRLSAHDESALADVEAEIHDWFFDLADVHHDSAAGQVLIPFRRWSYEQALPISSPKRRWPWSALRRLAGTRWEAPWYQWFLRVDGVRSFSMTDEAQIGLADFNTVAFDPRERTLTIDCSIPVTMRFEVERLTVYLEETDEVLGRARYRTSGDPRFATWYSGEVFPG